MNEDGTITFYDSNKKEVAFIIPEPIIYELDNKEKFTKSIRYNILNKEGDLVVTKIIDKNGTDWLLSEERNYPVAIDLVIDNVDSASEWVSSDPTNTPVQSENTIKYEGASSIKINTLPYQPTLSLDLMEYSSDANAQSNFVTNGRDLATGGTITYSGNDVIHTFTSDGIFTPTATPLVVQALVVAGGGGGGGKSSGFAGGAGGGGGGGVVYNSSYTANSPVTVTVGIGGIAGTGVAGATSDGGNGNNSVFGTITAIGGGGGGGMTSTTVARAGKSGGSGGGGGGGGGAIGGLLEIHQAMEALVIHPP